MSPAYRHEPLLYIYGGVTYREGDRVAYEDGSNNFIWGTVARAESERIAPKHQPVHAIWPSGLGWMPHDRIVKHERVDVLAARPGSYSSFTLASDAGHGDDIQ